MSLNKPRFFSAIFEKNPRVQFESPPFDPEAIKLKSTLYRATAAVKRMYSTEYSAGVKFPPQPHDSLPMPQNFTRNGSRTGISPPARRSAPVVEPAGELQYSIHS